MNKSIFYYITSSKLFYAIAFFLLFGIITTSMHISENNFFLLSDVVLTDLKFVCIFFLPAFMLFLFLYYQYRIENEEILIRFHGRKAIWKRQFIDIFICIGLFFLITLLCFIISFSFNNHANYDIKNIEYYSFFTHVPYTGNVLWILLFHMTQTFCFCYTLALFILFLLWKIKHPYVIIAIFLAFLLTIYTLASVDIPNKIICFLSPTTHLIGLPHSNLWISLLSTLLYHILLLPLPILLSKIVIQKSDILKETTYEGLL